MNKLIAAFNTVSQNLRQAMHNNLYLLIGGYGVLLITLICGSIEWLFNPNLSYAYARLLPPAWQNHGDLNHILGTDQLGQDILSYLLIAYRLTLIMTTLITVCTLIIATLITLLTIFIKPLAIVFNLISRLVIAIPPLILVILSVFLFNNTIGVLCLVVGFSYLPRFAHNIYLQISIELKKTYILAARLDGLPLRKIIYHYVFPNILPTYLTEMISLFCHVILALTTLTFLGFCDMGSHHDLGLMMYNMQNILQFNIWAFAIPGILILITIILMNVLNLGLQKMLTTRE